MYRRSAAASLWCYTLADVVVATALEVTHVVYLNYEEAARRGSAGCFQERSVTRSLSFCRA